MSLFNERTNDGFLLFKGGFRIVRRVIIIRPFRTAGPHGERFDRISQTVKQADQSLLADLTFDLIPFHFFPGITSLRPGVQVNMGRQSKVQFGARRKQFRGNVQWNAVNE